MAVVALYNIDGRWEVTVRSLVLICCLALCSPVHAGGLVALLSEQLGISEEQAAGGAGALLDVAKGQVSDADFAALAQSVPETEDLLAAAPKPSAETGSSATSLLDGQGGAQLENALGLAGSFESLGLDASTVQSFAPIVVDYFKEAGGDAAGDLLGGALTGGGDSSGGLSGLASAAPLLGLLSSDIGVGAEQAAGGAGALLRSAKDQLGEGDFSKVTDAVPGIQALLGMEPKSEDTGTSDLLGAAASLLGGGDGLTQQVVGALGVADTFDKLGLDAGMLDRFIPIILDYVQKKGGEVVSELLADGFSGGKDETAAPTSEEPAAQDAAASS